MTTTDVPRTELIHTRHTVAGDFDIPVAIDQLSLELRPGHDTSRWNPFIAATIPHSDIAAVVVPRHVSGTLRLTGEIVRPAATRLSVEAGRGLRGHGLRATHEIELRPTGSFLTHVRLSTTIRGPASALVSRRRIADWHRDEIAALKARIERNHDLRRAPTRSRQLDSLTNAPA